MSKVSREECDYLFVKQVGAPLLPLFYANFVDEWRRQVLRLTWTGSKGDSCGYAGHTAAAGIAKRDLVLVVSGDLFGNH